MKRAILAAGVVFSLTVYTSCTKCDVEPDNCQSACNYQQTSDNCNSQQSCQQNDNNYGNTGNNVQYCSNRDTSCFKMDGNCDCGSVSENGQPGNWCSGGPACSCIH